MKQNNSFYIAIIMVSVLTIFIFSCNKEKNPKATITVLNGESSNVAVEGATVKIFSDPTMTDTTHEGDIGYVYPDSNIVDEIKLTDEYGQTHHEFRYESILHVEAKLGLSKDDTLIGYGALILKADETYEETVIMKYKPSSN